MMTMSQVGYDGTFSTYFGSLTLLHFRLCSIRASSPIFFLKTSGWMDGTMHRRSWHYGRRWSSGDDAKWAKFTFHRKDNKKVFQWNFRVKQTFSASKIQIVWLEVCKIRPRESITCVGRIKIRSWKGTKERHNKILSFQKYQAHTL